MKICGHSQSKKTCRGTSGQNCSCPDKVIIVGAEKSYPDNFLSGQRGSSSQSSTIVKIIKNGFFAPLPRQFFDFSTKNCRGSGAAGQRGYLRLTLIPERMKQQWLLLLPQSGLYKVVTLSSELSRLSFEDLKNR